MNVTGFPLRKRAKSGLSAALVLCLAGIALLAGWILKSNILNETQSVLRSGVSLQVPASWKVQFGIAEENQVFSAVDPLNLLHNITAVKLPMATDGLVTDAVVNQNLKRATVLSSYQVLEQAPYVVKGVQGYAVYYAYVENQGTGNLPVVVRGLDIYLPFDQQIVLISLEENESRFGSALPEFFRVLDSISYTPGE